MPNESIERFDLVYDRAFDGTMENPHIGPWVTGSFIRLSDHKRIVKELEAERSEWQSVAEKYQALVKRTEQDALSHAIKEVEKLRDEYKATERNAETAYHCGNATVKDLNSYKAAVVALLDAIQRLKSLGPQKED